MTSRSTKGLIEMSSRKRDTDEATVEAMLEIALTLAHRQLQRLAPQQRGTTQANGTPRVTT